IVDGRIPVIDNPRELMVKQGKKSVRVEYYENNGFMMSEFDLKGIGQNQEFHDLIKTKEIKTIHSQEATLEDIFIKMTGRELV
ncbi:MAG: ABC transporter ATP-binding protein, partial [Ignavibacteria bacterium]|nr:ABC transporter ATP-binding protein [Ignavibacteria bacterium]